MSGYESSSLSEVETIVDAAGTAEDVYQQTLPYSERAVAAVAATMAAEPFDGGRITQTLEIGGPTDLLRLVSIDPESADTFVLEATRLGLSVSPDIDGTAFYVQPLVATSAGNDLGTFAPFSGNNRVRVSRNCFLQIKAAAAPADDEVRTGELSFWFDSTNGAAKLKIKAKTADGTVVQGEVALT